MQTTDLASPTAPGQWSLSQIQQALSRPLPKPLLATRKQGGQMLEYIPWHLANKILDKYAPGWTWQIMSVTNTEVRLVLVGRLTIPTAEGNVYREATGQEEHSCGSYGDPSSNAESMAFRRAAARFGLGLYLYDK